MTGEKAIEVLKSECYVFPFLNGDRAALINTALDVAIEALIYKMNYTWRKDKPKDNKYVLVSYRNGVIDKDFWDGERWQYEDNYGDVMAWMPLPIYED